ncbi:MAG TPA: GatB/YqeY domain-containing protein [Chloroflexi bacterium]|jgi:uncharacterized protein YqeY|nr:GatB/YqeY domain-containing protein [Chloroflexota bacterium]
MNLKERLMADLKDAMRQGDIPRREAIRMARAAVINAEIAWQREATDAEVQQVIAQEVKRRVEAIELFRQGGRDDLVRAEEAQLGVLRAYLPEQLSREEVTAVVQRVIDAMGATSPAQLGPVMRQVMAELKGKADGRMVNEIVRDLLAQ